MQVSRERDIGIYFRTDFIKKLFDTYWRSRLIGGIRRIGREPIKRVVMLHAVAIIVQLRHYSTAAATKHCCSNKALLQQQSTVAAI